MRLPAFRIFSRFGGNEACKRLLSILQKLVDKQANGNFDALLKEKCIKRKK
jgi:hypothetical protein